ncbi:unnamed protein product [Clonostachys byssicola]|uniref:monoamine oxidase n=1 Tax=Clonostachys byssicola TaxID=160290 RepID=A0A9N9Y7F6_9HYPO|nr:unnamed protein product [Clonostachys byssicola]
MPLTTLVLGPELAFPQAKLEIKAVAAIGGLFRQWNALNGHFCLKNLAASDIFPRHPVETDVVVVEAGFSGLVAAYEMQQAGLEIVLLEARNRVGGRSYSIPLKSGP